MTEPRLPADLIDSDSPWWTVHASRYRFATRFLGGGPVLDMACGAGYGLQVLGQEAGARPVGADISPDALCTARIFGPVASADAARLPFRDEAFDAVVSMETLEHLILRDEFVQELRRVLQPGGLLVLSTPNAVYTRPIEGRPTNPHHVHEYTPDELVATLAAAFEGVRLYGQRLHDRFGISPFHDDQVRMTPTLVNRVRLLMWKVLNRLPGRARDGIATRLLGHPIRPRVEDFVFDDARVSDAPVLVAVGRRSEGS